MFSFSSLGDSLVPDLASTSGLGLGLDLAPTLGLGLDLVLGNRGSLVFFIGLLSSFL